MPKVFRRPGSPYYYYRLSVHGRDRWLSTGETDRDKAAKIAQGHHRAIGRGLTLVELTDALLVKLAQVPAAHREDSRQEVVQRLLNLQDRTLAIDAAWQRWSGSPMKGNPAESTATHYKAIWSRFEKWATAAGVTHLHNVTKKHASDYLTDLWATGITGRTYNAHWKFLRSFFTLLKDDAGVPFNPFDGIRRMEQHTQGREAFTAEELQAIGKHAEGDLRYIMAICIYTGLRLGDAALLKWPNVTGDRISLIPLKTRRKNKRVEVMLHPALVKLLDEIRPTGKATGYLFPETAKRYLQDRGYPGRLFNKLLDECGIAPTAEGVPQGAHRRRRAAIKGFHSLRHSFVSLCAVHRVPQAVIQQLVGHGSPAMTAAYTHVTDQQQKTALKALPGKLFSR